MTEQFENDLLREAEGLDILARLFQEFDEILEQTIDEYGEHLDVNLVLLLEMVRYDVNLTLNGVVPLDNVKVLGIIKQLDDVMDEVQTFQAGLATRGGVENEDVQEDDQ